ncbi:receptor-like protein 7 isoform X2 [Juglans regia]|uniref:Receptor-like protein 7 isoform X2 n=1 Tax=Juglans regia TaxID=51240 RepID=A0A6P9EPC1_JUGRE|nr:receptor-like protein 7 isoform X2 [Juglans regia]
MHLLFPLIACLLLSLLPHSLSYNLPLLCHQEERVALMHFKDSFIIQNYSVCGLSTDYPKEVASWRVEGNNTNCCAWDGVECNQDTGHVIALNLSRSCLYGSITSNSSLFRLLHLQNLTLANNDFNHSQIPSEIGNLSSLTHLDLSYSQFSGQIPSAIQYLSKLSFLSLYSYYDNYGLYTKNLASLVQNLTNLETLDFFGINISSTVPESLANLSSLKLLALSNCSLYGQFPTRIFHLPHLQKLDVWSNEDLTGTIPNSFSNLTQLTTLDLSANPFNDLSWLTRVSSNDILPQFGFLGLAHLNLTKLPDILRNQSKLEYLDLEGNNLQGLIPKWMHNVSKESLQNFYISNNFLTGIENSPTIISWPNLKYFAVDDNMMHGSLPIPPFTIYLQYEFT